jgi:pimeloyl-ACP methyl ester carboxylesterase
MELSAERRSRIRVAEGIELQVAEWGAADGRPLAILHGGGHDARCWQGVCEGLPPLLRSIVPDQRGHGGSSWSPTGDYSCEAQAVDFERLLDALEIECTAVLGHSMGGLNALHFAGHHPERVSALILVDVGTETRKAGLERIRSRERKPVEPPSENAPFDTRLLDFVPTYCGDAAVRRRLLAASDAPLLVLRGERSRILSRESAAVTAELGGGKVVEIPDAGHSVSLDNPEAVARAIAQFLEATQGGTPGRLCE